jgi:hyperosmotically inducible protein
MFTTQGTETEGTLIRRIGYAAMAACLVAGLSACQSSPDYNSSSQDRPSKVEKAERYVDDAAITTAVKTKLASDRVSNLTRIDVTTNSGAVNLSGTVDTTEQKEQASRLAGQVDGVKHVNNNLQVKNSGPTSQTDRVIQ